MTWLHLNLGELEPRPPTEPTLGGLGFMYPGKRHVFSGPQESAKTLAAYAAALEEIRAGGFVVALDFEMGQWDARTRFVELGATGADFARLVYIEPDTPADPGELARIVGLEPTLALIDAAAGAYQLEGLDDNKRVDVERFAATFVTPLWRNGVATLVVDHVVKNPDNRGSYTIGSERKVGGADVHIGFSVASPLQRGGTGRYRLTTHKDRGGYLKRGNLGSLVVRSDPQTHALTCSFELEEHREGQEWEPTGYMERVSIYLESSASDPSRRTTRNGILDGVTGAAEYVRAAIDALIRLGYAQETASANRSRPVTLLKPFRESEYVGVRRQYVATHSDPYLSGASVRSPLSRGDVLADAGRDDALRPPTYPARGSLTYCPTHDRETTVDSVAAGRIFLACGCFVADEEELPSNDEPDAAAPEIPF